jgi:transcriptional regulator with XRE-family HTH domain
MGNNGTGLKDFGRNLDRVWRQRESDWGHDILQADVAEAVGKMLGGEPLSQGTISKWRKGKSEPDLRTIRALAAFFDVHPSDLAWPPVGEMPTPMPKDSAPGEGE